MTWMLYWIDDLIKKLKKTSQYLHENGLSGITKNLLRCSPGVSWRGWLMLDGVTCLCQRVRRTWSFMILLWCSNGASDSALNVPPPARPPPRYKNNLFLDTSVDSQAVCQSHSKTNAQTWVWSHTTHEGWREGTHARARRPCNTFTKCWSTHTLPVFSVNNLSALI